MLLMKTARRCSCRARATTSLTESSSRMIEGVKPLLKESEYPAAIEALL